MALKLKQLNWYYACYVCWCRQQLFTLLRSTCFCWLSYFALLSLLLNELLVFYVQAYSAHCTRVFHNVERNFKAWNATCVTLNCQFKRRESKLDSVTLIKVPLNVIQLNNTIFLELLSQVHKSSSNNTWAKYVLRFDTIHLIRVWNVKYQIYS